MDELTEAQEQQLEEWHSEFMDLETTLTIYQVLLLLKIKAGADGMGILEPVWVQCTPEWEKVPLYQAPIALKETVLLECAQAQALERLGLISIDPQEHCWRLTEKGEAAEKWWREAIMEDIWSPLENSLSETSPSGKG